MNQVRFSSHKYGRYGISGHVGVGHVHSHSGYVQDDSAGFSAAVWILKHTLPADTRIARIDTDCLEGTITVTTRTGGSASVCPRRGITPSEADILVERGVGIDAAFPQTAAVHVFGRLYGQGISELACAFEGACALSVIDTFVKLAPTAFHRMRWSPTGTHDTAIATVLDIDGLAVSLMLVVNYTQGGLGPIEDYEGNSLLGDKGRIMYATGLDHVPTIILESKAYIPALSDEEDDFLLIRAQRGIDHIELAEATCCAADQYQIPCVLRDDLMPFSPGFMKTATKYFANQLITQAHQLEQADTALQKVNILGELSKLVSEDAGGVTFMSNEIHDEIRSAGILPGISAVLSMVVSKQYCSYMKVPTFTPQDAETYGQVALNALKVYDQDRYGGDQLD